MAACSSKRRGAIAARQMAGDIPNAVRLIRLAQYSVVTPESAFALIQGLDEYSEFAFGPDPG